MLIYTDMETKLPCHHLVLDVCCLLGRRRILKMSFPKSLVHSAAGLTLTLVVSRRELFQSNLRTRILVRK